MPLNILLVTPAPPGTRLGNRQTAMRWARHLRGAGHEVDVVVDAHEAPRKRAHDLMIALHARKSTASMQAWKSNPERPLILVLTGTDIYRDVHTDTAAQSSLHLADRLVLLQAEALRELTPALQGKARVIYQSVPPIERLATPVSYTLVTVIGHLREEKDPFRAVAALQHLPAHSRIRIVHLGSALSEEMAAQARDHASAPATRERYRWLEDLPHGETLRWLARSDALVISSHLEGGAHVVSEAIAAGVPVLASRIPGNVGLLGADYPAYFPVGDEVALAQLMLRIETDKRYGLTLARAVSARRHLVDVDAEREAVLGLVLETIQRRVI